MSKTIRDTRADTPRAVTVELNRTRSSGQAPHLTAGQRRHILDTHRTRTPSPRPTSSQR